MTRKNKQKKQSRALAPNSSSFESDVIKVYQMLLEGHSKGDILEAIAQLYPNRDANKLIASAMESFSIISSEQSDTVKGWCMEATRDLFRKLNEVGDYDGALRAVQQFHKIAHFQSTRKPSSPHDDLGNLDLPDAT